MEKTIDDNGLYRNLFVNNHICMLVIDPVTQKIVDANPAACKFYGYELDKMVSMPITEINMLSFNEESHIISNALSEKQNSYILKHKRADGTFCDVEVFTGSIQNKGQTLLYSIIYDITKRKQAEEALRESENRYRLIAENTGDVIWILDLENMRFSYVSPSVYRLRGYTAEEVMSQDVSVSLTTESLTDVQNKIPLRFEKYLEGIREFYVDRVAQPCKDGTVVWTETVTRYMADEYSGRPIVLGVSRDITERKQAEEAFQDSEFQFRELWGATVEGITIHDHGIIFEVNDAMCRIFGYTHDQVIGRSLLDFASDEEKDRVHEHFMSGSELAFETAALRADGVKIILEVFAKQILYHGKYMRMAAVRDITERKRVEDALRTTKLLLEQTIEQCPVPMVLVSMPDAMFRYINSACLKFLGIEDIRETLIDKPLTEFKAPFQDFDIQGIEGKFDELPLARSLMGLRTEGEERYIRRKDGTIRYELVNATPIMDGEGQIVAGYLIMIDITERILAEKALKDNILELEEAKEKAEESDRLKTAFLQNMSHEIRTPLNAIMGFADLLSYNFQNKEKLKYFTSVIKQRGSDLIEIISDILDIAKIESGQLSVKLVECKLSDVFSEIETIYKEYRRRMNKEHVDFCLNFQCDLPDNLVVIDQLKMKQILTNLITNAFKFTNAGKVEVGCKAGNNNSFIFYVSDTGIGIPKEKHSVIFGRFAQVNQSISGLYGGTGLGLSIVKGLLDLLGGKIWLDSEPGKGSIFYFTIPFEISNKEINEIKTKVQIPVSKSDATILIVEDDYYNAEYLKEIFTGTNYHILHTEYGKQAIDISINQDVDIVLMDIRLPDIQGFEVTRLIKEQKPNIKIIAQTAYATPQDQQKALEVGCIDYVSKPVKRELLLSKIEFYLGNG
jgi:PAS domain S-box-containing protein